MNLNVPDAYMRPPPGCVADARTVGAGYVITRESGSLDSSVYRAKGVGSHTSPRPIPGQWEEVTVATTGKPRAS